MANEFKQTREGGASGNVRHQEAQSEYKDYWGDLERFAKRKKRDLILSLIITAVIFGGLLWAIL